MDKKDSKTDKTKNNLIYDPNHNFYKYRFSKFAQMSSIESKFNTLEMFYRQFISLKSLEVRTKENTNHKSVVLNNALNEYDKLIKEYKKIYERESNNDKSCGWKQKYNPKNLKALDYQPAELETKSLADGNRSDLKQPTPLKQLKLDEISKPLWINLSTKNFNSLIKDAVDNLDNEDYNRRYDLKNAENFLLEIITKKISEKEACKLYNSLIKPHVDTLMKSRIRDKNKRKYF